MPPNDTLRLVAVPWILAVPPTSLGLVRLVAVPWILAVPPASLDLVRPIYCLYNLFPACLILHLVFLQCTVPLQCKFFYPDAFLFSPMHFTLPQCNSAPCIVAMHSDFTMHSRCLSHWMYLDSCLHHYCDFHLYFCTFICNAACPNEPPYQKCATWSCGLYSQQTNQESCRGGESSPLRWPGPSETQQLSQCNTGLECYWFSTYCQHDAARKPNTLHFRVVLTLSVIPIHYQWPQSIITDHYSIINGHNLLSVATNQLSVATSPLSVTTNPVSVATNPLSVATIVPIQYQWPPVHYQWLPLYQSSIGGHQSIISGYHCTNPVSVATSPLPVATNPLSAATNPLPVGPTHSSMPVSFGWQFLSVMKVSLQKRQMLAAFWPIQDKRLCCQCYIYVLY